jgi:glycosyltransferase involved in cell wall biosynthesis
LGFYSAQNILKRYPPPFRWTEQWVYRASTFAFPCSETVLGTLRKKGYRHAATQLPLGLDPQLYRPYADDAALRDRLADGAEVLFGYVGRIAPEKGIATLFQALAHLPGDLNWRLAVVGTGDHDSPLQALAHSSGIAHRISWIGYIEHTEVPRYLSAFDVLVVPSETQPSWKEQFGRVIVEALACETPVVGTDSGEIPYLLRRTGGGTVVAERNPGALADALATFAKTPMLRHTYGQQGAEYVRTHLSHATLANSFAGAIEQAVSAPTSPGAATT